jgi:hypothetical protein
MVSLIALLGLGGCGDDDAATPVSDAGRLTDSGTTMDEDGGTTMDEDSGTTMDEDGGTTMDEDGGTTMDEDAGMAGLSFAKDVYPIISTRCTPCHTESVSGTLAMPNATTAHGNLLGVASTHPDCGDGDRIVAGNAAASVLYRKVTGMNGRLCGSQMPFMRMELPAGEIATIEAWINSGAAP